VHIQVNMYYGDSLFWGEFCPKPEMVIPALDVTWLSFLVFLESQNTSSSIAISRNHLNPYNLFSYVIFCNNPQLSHSISHAVSIMGLPGTTLHNPCSPIGVAVVSLQSTHFKSGKLLWSWCSSRPDG